MIWDWIGEVSSVEKGQLVGVQRFLVKADVVINSVEADWASQASRGGKDYRVKYTSTSIRGVG